MCTPNTIASLLSLVEQITESGCWIFMGHVTEYGYARVGFQGRQVRVHRLFYEHFIGPIPSGLVSDHLCRVRCCVNPWHLEPVTDRTNTLRGNSVSAIESRKISCKRGHSFSPENTRITVGRRRRCRICEMERKRIERGSLPERFRGPYKQPEAR